jgi:two-component system response regulator FixJ
MTAAAMNDFDNGPPPQGRTSVGRIALVEEDDWVRLSTARLLQNEGYLVDCYASGDALLSDGDLAAVDAVLLDMEMPGANGLDTLRALAGRDERPCVLVTSRHGDIGLAVEAMKLGAIDFLEKPVPRAALIAAIAEAAALHEHRGAVDAVRLLARQRIGSLSERQLQILARIVNGRSNKAIAFELGLSVRTIEAYRAELLARLGVRSTAEAVRLALAADLI